MRLFCFLKKRVCRKKSNITKDIDSRQRRNIMKERLKLGNLSVKFKITGVDLLVLLIAISSINVVSVYTVK